MPARLLLTLVALVLWTAPLPARQAGLLSALVGYWNLNETSGTRADSHGSNTLSDTNAVGNMTGVLGNAAAFDGGDYLSIADNVALSTGDITFSVAIWARMASSGSYRVLANKGWDESDSEWVIYTIEDTRVPLFGVRYSSITSEQVTATWGAALSLDTWYLIAAGHNNTTNEVWISVNAGTPVTTGHSLGVNDGARPFVIGSSISQGLFWDGGADEAMFFKGDIRSDLSWLYNSGSARSYADIVAAAGGDPPTAGPCLRSLLGIGRC